MPLIGDLTPSEFSELAHAIWRECYPGVISESQIEFMLHVFQSPEAISKEIANGFVYKAIFDGDKVCGYSAHIFRNDSCFISKIYVSASHRRRGLGSWRLSMIFNKASAAGCKKAYLFVNKGNTGSIAFYESRGMRKIDSTVTDIGGGFVMDDYVFEKSLIIKGN